MYDDVVVVGGVDIVLVTIFVFVITFSADLSIMSGGRGRPLVWLSKLIFSLTKIRSQVDSRSSNHTYQVYTHMYILIHCNSEEGLCRNINQNYDWSTMVLESDRLFSRIYTHCNIYVYLYVYTIYVYTDWLDNWIQSGNCSSAFSWEEEYVTYKIRNNLDYPVNVARKIYW